MKNPLLWAFLAGAVLILVIRLALPNLSGAIAAALAAIAIVWWLGSYYAANKVKQRDRAGDDLYYLGLLLTLVSLIYALVSLFILPEAGDVQGRVYALIGNFGIALLSTVAGILGRILLQDSSSERLDSTRTSARGATQDAGEKTESTAAWHEQETLLTAEMRESATDMMQLRRQLREAADAFAYFTRVTLSHADHTKSHTELLLEDFNQRMATVAERGIDNTAAAWQRVGEAMRKDGEGLLGRIEEAVSGAAERTEGAWRGLVGQIESASMAARDRLHTDAEEAAQTLMRLKTANDSLSALASALDDVQRRISTLAEKAAGATAALDANTAEAIAAQKALVEGAKASQAAALQSFEAAAKALTSVADEFDTAVRAHREQTKGTMTDAQLAMDAMIAGLQAAEQNIASLGRTASQTATTLKPHTAGHPAMPGPPAAGVAEGQEGNPQFPHEPPFAPGGQPAQETDAEHGPGDGPTRSQGAQTQRREDNPGKTQHSAEQAPEEASRHPSNLANWLRWPFDRRP